MIHLRTIIKLVDSIVVCRVPDSSDDAQNSNNNTAIRLGGRSGVQLALQRGTDLLQYCV